jgi:hypothetical protein
MSELGYSLQIVGRRKSLHVCNARKADAKSGPWRLDRPEIPLHTNGSENDIRCQVTKRKISGGTRSDTGRNCRDAFLGLAKTCAKLKIAFWDYLGSRLQTPNHPDIPSLPQLIKHRCATA